jgi:methyl-accepting chemotaxis protein
MNTLSRRDAKLEWFPALCRGLVILGFVEYFLGLTQFSFADACLLAAALFLCAGAANPLFFLLAKEGGSGADQLGHLEHVANWTGLFAAGLALMFGLVGTFAFAYETVERKTYLDGLVENVVTIKRSADYQRGLDSESMKRIEQNLNSKGDELKGLIAAVNERLSKIDKDLQQLRAGEARDARVDDLLSKSDLLAETVKQNATDISQQAQKLDELRGKIDYVISALPKKRR